MNEFKKNINTVCKEEKKERLSNIYKSICLKLL